MHGLSVRRGHVLAHVIGPDGQLAMAAVNDDRQAHRIGAAVVHERVKRGTDGTAREQHVVYQDDCLALE